MRFAAPSMTSPTMAGQQRSGTLCSTAGARISLRLYDGGGPTMLTKAIAPVVVRV